MKRPIPEAVRAAIAAARLALANAARKEPCDEPEEPRDSLSFLSQE